MGGDAGSPAAGKRPERPIGAAPPVTSTFAFDLATQGLDLAPDLLGQQAAFF
ncbi:hypothetical protein SAMN06265370_103161 [Puniceibacterium sediminis]|uniref:Uncharacterized protein n=1 Tax=Puniceibacterium sediminis TaxID=1608407 RepID=A0A238VTW9_9RHOB|nr:hypothetical protein SAMN06265370_103161 [Puniceibacterium sediminis]